LACERFALRAHKDRIKNAIDIDLGPNMPAGEWMIRAELMGFVIALGVVVMFKMLTNRINVQGLLRPGPNLPTSVGNAQVLVATIVALSDYLTSLGYSPLDKLPDVPEGLLLLLGSSNLLYLTGVGAARLGWLGILRGGQM
jgi:hypothetical protein